jgi:hypothetical protein
VEFKLRPKELSLKTALSERTAKLLEENYAEHVSKMKALKEIGNDEHRISTLEGMILGLNIAAIYLGHEFVEVNDKEDVKSS